jgi:amino acid transporter
VSDAASGFSSAKQQLPRVMGFWDVLLFCIATVLGPRWIAAAAHSGQSSISLWILAAVLFFVPTAYVVVELSTRFPEEGGLYVWTKMAFGDFHGFVAGWTYWTYTIFYFPGLLMASAAMTAYVGGSGTARLAQNQTFLLGGSLAMLIVAVWLNIIGLRIGKWLQNAGGVGTYTPLLMIVGVALWLGGRQGSVTHFSAAAMLPHWDWDTVNFWSQIAFAFTGLELVSAMSEEVRDPQRTLPKAIFASGGLIAVIYIAGTVAILTMIPADVVDPKSGVFQAITTGSNALRIGIVGVIAALLVTVGNAGDFASAVYGGHRSLSSVLVRQDPSKVEDAAHFDFGSGRTFGGGSGAQPIQGNGKNRVRGAGFRRHRLVFHSVYLYVCGGHQAGLGRRPREG